MSDTVKNVILKDLGLATLQQLFDFWRKLLLEGDLGKSIVIRKMWSSLCPRPDVLEFGIIALSFSRLRVDHGRADSARSVC